LFESGRASDIVFRVEGREFPGHKAIIMSRSEVLATICEASGTTEVIDIEGASAEVFEAVLRYCYGDVVPVYRVREDS